MKKRYLSSVAVIAMLIVAAGSYNPLGTANASNFQLQAAPTTSAPSGTSINLAPLQLAAPDVNQNEGGGGEGGGGGGGGGGQAGASNAALGDTFSSGNVGGQGVLTIDQPKNGQTLYVNDYFTASGKCTVGSKVTLKADVKAGPISVSCDQNGQWSIVDMVWNTPKPELNQYGNEITDFPRVISVIQNADKRSVNINIQTGGTGFGEGGGCRVYDYQIWIDPCEGEPEGGEGYGGGCFNLQGQEITCPAGVLTIDVPKKGALLKKPDGLAISGKCDPYSHVFLNLQTTKNPVYAYCSPQGTYQTSNLKWLDAVKAGTTQSIVANEVNNDAKKYKTVDSYVTLVIEGILQLNQCNDGVDNDNDGVKDKDDPGCWKNPTDPGTYDPNDNDETNPQCFDQKDNDNDNKKDQDDPGCWLDPNDPGTYDPGDDNEGDEPTGGQCKDGKDNDNDGKIDEKDPGCHTDGDENNPDSYDPDDNNEGDEPSCNDGKDNDNDGKVDEKDPGCHTDGDENNPDSYDPGDNNEGDEPACNDGKDNDNDGKVDEKDPGCHTDGNPNNPGSYDPGDKNEGDEPVVPQCKDGINNNDGDNVKDGEDPGCWTNPKDSSTYDPNDNNETNPACYDQKDNDNDGKIDQFDPDCWKNPNDPGSYDPSDNDESGNNGSLPYDPGTDYVGDANRECLKYNPLRNLTFVDVNDLNATGARAAIALKNTYLAVDNIAQYLLSGYGSDLQSSGKAVVGMNDVMKRIEFAKLVMLSHCLPVLDEDTLPNVRSNGDPMISYRDLSRSGNAPSTLVQDIAYTIQFYSSDEEAAMRGTDEGNFEPFRAITLEEIMKPITVIQEFRTGKLSPRDNTSVAAVANRWSYEFYAKAAYQKLVQYIPNALSRPTDNVIRKNAFDLLIHAMLQRNLYNAQDQATVSGIVNQ